MQAYGSDRLRVRDDGAAILSCRIPKPDWQARAVRTLTTPEHPGTAVLWEEAWWEVLDIEVLQQSVRYTLAPWPEAHAMRFTSRYDAEAEEARAIEQRRQVMRTRGRFAANLLGVITGHLPAAVQNALASETGIVPHHLTMISAIPPFALSVSGVTAAVGAVIAQKPLAVPTWLAIVVMYTLVDSIVRFLFALSSQQPIGSVYGLIAYALYYLVAPKRGRLVAPLAAEKGSSVRTTALSDDAALESAIAPREPIFSLLDTADQRRVAERYGVDYRKTAPTMAWILLVFSLLGVASSIQKIAGDPFALLSTLTAGYLLVEQIWRLTRIPHAPAPSILRFALRWTVRRYL